MKMIMLKVRNVKNLFRFRLIEICILFHGFWLTFLTHESCDNNNQLFTGLHHHTMYMQDMCSCILLHPCIPLILSFMLLLLVDHGSVLVSDTVLRLWCFSFFFFLFFFFFSFSFFFLRKCHLLDHVDACHGITGFLNNGTPFVIRLKVKFLAINFKVKKPEFSSNQG